VIVISLPRPSLAHCRNYTTDRLSIMIERPGCSQTRSEFNEPHNVKHAPAHSYSKIMSLFVSARGAAAGGAADQQSTRLLQGSADTPLLRAKAKMF
jgi:hypothetical protein